MGRQVILWIAIGAALAAVAKATHGLLALASGTLAMLALILAGIFLIVGGLARRRPGARPRVRSPGQPDADEEGTG